MKVTFYAYWTVYILLIFISDISMNIEMAMIVLCLKWGAWIYLGAYPMYAMYVYQEKVNPKYLLGCLISFLLRGVITVFAIYGLESKPYILAISGMVIICFYILGAGDKNYYRR